MSDKLNFLNKLYMVQNTFLEERNYLEILKGYCENNLEQSDDLNKIYPLISLIYDTHQDIFDSIQKIISDL